MVITLLLGILVGAVLGLTGAGGAILAVPALVFSMGWSMQQAAPVALIAVAGSATLGAIEGLRQHQVRYRAALLMAAVGMAVTPLGIAAARLVPQQWLGALFAVVMLVVAARLFRTNDDTTGRFRTSPKAGSINPDTGRFNWNWPTRLLLGAIGTVTGFMAGILGVGGGFVMVPMLRRFTDVSMHGVVATSLMVTALVAAGAVISALLQGAVMPVDTTLLFAGATAIGMLSGRLLSRHISARHVQIGFAAILVGVACSLLFRSFA